MNNKKVSRETTSAIFLAIVLVAGTFALSSPSFMVGAAQAQPYYGMDKKYSNYEQDYEMNSYDKKPYGQESYGKDKDKSKDSRSDLLKKLKCNNINANLNNIDANFGGPVEDDTNGANGGAGEALSAQGSEAISANGLMNGGRDGDRSFVDRENDFVFVCINNNNNTIIEETPIPPVDECPEADEIESCFRQFLLDDLFPNFVETLESEAGITVDINGQEVTLRSFEDICLALEGLTFNQLNDAVNNIIQEALGFVPMGLEEFYRCIAEALEIPVPPR